MMQRASVVLTMTLALAAPAAAQTTATTGTQTTGTQTTGAQTTGTTGTAGTQTGTGQATGKPAEQPLHLSNEDNGVIRHHFSVMVSGGSDLDVIGNLLAPGQGTINGQPATVNNDVRYPDVYFKTPVRYQAGVAFGIFGKDEIFYRMSRATYAAQPDDVGVAGPNNNSLVANVNAYSDRAYEYGFRHYFSASGGIKQYISFSGGKKNIQALSATLSSSATGTIGPVRLYDAGRRNTFALCFGATFEVAHIGVFLEGGVQIVSKLLRDDTDLRAYGLQDINNTGRRFYMPAQFGIVLRL